MGAIATTYTEALKEFESLTTKRAATLKNKGKEAGVKKLSVLFKSGKTLDQRIADYENALKACETAKQPADQAKRLKELVVAKTKLVEGLKLNLKAFETEAKGISPEDAEFKAGYEIFAKRLSMMANRVRMEVEQRSGAAAKASGKQTVDAKLANEIKTVYLNIKKGCDETEALMKAFMTRPTKENFMAAFSSGTGPRSISVAVTNWKQIVLKTDPTATNRLGYDPEHLILKIFDATQRKNEAFWDGKVQFSQPGWETRAKKEAQLVLDQVKNWRSMVAEMKAMIS